MKVMPDEGLCLGLLGCLGSDEDCAGGVSNLRKVISEFTQAQETEIRGGVSNRQSQNWGEQGSDPRVGQCRVPTLVCRLTYLLCAGSTSWPWTDMVWV
jgi:hypothetical protein